MTSTANSKSTPTESHCSTPIADGGDNLQGQFNWRKILKPVKTPDQEHKPFVPEENTEVNEEPREDERNLQSPVERLAKDSRKLVKDERLEDNKIRERLKALPVWKRELMEKKTKGPMVARPNILGAAGPSGAPSNQSSASSPNTSKRRLTASNHLADSAFTRQVVNKPVSPGVPRKRVSPSNSFNKPRTPSPNQPSDNDSLSQEAAKRKVEKVLRARLYLLQQMGPNSFLIGGDSPDHKFRIIIGPQTCSCGRGHCVHLLFVMLRVFQVRENDPCLWVKELKNYEVENLFRNYHVRRTQRIRTPNKKKSSRLQANPSEISESPDSSTTNSETGSNKDEEETKEEEETCPICLLEMIEGESLVKCELGCQNKLHHHCIAVWFEECKRQKEQLICPLCRAKWKAAVEDVGSGGTNSPAEPSVPPNTRASSPQNTPQEADVILPRAEPIPPESMDIARHWIPVLGEELVSCLFSRNWSMRETALRHVTRTATGSLLLGVGEGRTGAHVSPTRQASTHQMLECCMSVLAYTCADPVYRVFVASLRTLRTLLSYTPCRDAPQQERLSILLKGILDAILLKCADGNRRTSQLSISTLMELAKGQQGELALGREIVNPGSEGLGGVRFVMRSIIEAYDEETVQWQWLLGRLCTLDKLLETFPTEFVLRQKQPNIRTCPDAEPNPDDRPTNYDVLIMMLEFSVKAVNNSHTRIGKLSRKVFILASRLAAHLPDIFREIEGMLSTLDRTLQERMRKRLNGVADEFHIAQQVARLVQQEPYAVGPSGDGSVPLPPCSTPVLSPESSPRSSSPVPVMVEPEHLTVDATNTALPPTPSKTPMAPPNSPRSTRIKRRPTIPRKPNRKAIAAAVVASSTPSTPSEASGPVTEPSSPGESTPSEPACPPTTPEHQPAPKPAAEGIGCTDTAMEQAELAGPQFQLNGEVLSGDELIRKGEEEEEVAGDEDGEEEEEELGNTEDELENTEDELDQTEDEGLDDDEEDEKETTEKSETSLPPPSSSNNHEDVVHFPVEEYKFPRSREGSHSEDISEESSGPRAACSEEYLSSGMATPNSPSTSSGAMLTEDLSDLTMSPVNTPEDRPVSFKSEVASSSPRRHLRQPVGARSLDDEKCSCKEEVEAEEAEALSKAMLYSEDQSDLPIVPGLSPDSKEETVMVRVQDKPSENGSADHPDAYLENVHWVRGPLLGTGAFSTCYQARDVKHGVVMAVKQISFCRNSSSEQLKVMEAIEEEIQMMAKLSHPNITRILGATRQGCHFNMFVEWMPGGSVAYLLDVYGAFSETVIVRYTQQILRGLAYLHESHILHRDLKGANLLVDSTGQKVRIADFGAAARLARRQTGAGEFQGQLLGTIAFMAPEVLRGESYGRSCDIWSFGCCMIEMITTKPPWGASDVSNHLALIFKIASAITPPPIPENLSPAVKDLLLRCLEPQREDRQYTKDLLQHPLFTRYNNG